MTNNSLQHHWAEVVSRTVAGRSGARDFLSSADTRALERQAGGYYRDAEEQCESMERFARQAYERAIEALRQFALPEGCKNAEAAGLAAIEHLMALAKSVGYYESLGVRRVIRDLNQAVELEMGKIRIAAAGLTGETSGG